MKVNKVVEYVLRNNPQARNSDKELILDVFSVMGLNLTQQQREKFKELPSTESIRRVRQKLQEEGKFLASEKIQQAREIKSQEVQQTAPTASPASLERLLEQRTENRSLGTFKPKRDPWMES